MAPNLSTLEHVDQEYVSTALGLPTPRDIPLKNSVLRDALNGYATLAAVVSGNLNEFFASSDLVTDVVRSSGVVESEIQELVDRVAMLTPILAAWASMVDSMASNRLAQAISQAMNDNSFIEDPGQALMGVMLSHQTSHREWIKFAEVVLERHGERRVVFETIRFIAMISYMDPSARPGRQRDLEALLASTAISARTFSSNAMREEVRARFIRELKKRRNLKMLNASMARNDSVGLMNPGI
ncbi:hypothetical protein ACFXI6_48645 [Streptomyces mirabilis]|uniref:hypothetical protein n=1 Tax=Streptomyces mirabilis TaxID=68239 RepID=UPI0036BDEC48